MVEENLRIGMDLQVNHKLLTGIVIGAVFVAAAIFLLPGSVTGKFLSTGAERVVNMAPAPQFVDLGFERPDEAQWSADTTNAGYTEEWSSEGEKSFYVIGDSFSLRLEPLSVQRESSTNVSDRENCSFSQDGGAGEDAPLNANQPGDQLAENAEYVCEDAWYYVWVANYAADYLGDYAMERYVNPVLREHEATLQHRKIVIPAEAEYLAVDIRLDQPVTREGVIDFEARGAAQVGDRALLAASKVVFIDSQTRDCADLPEQWAKYVTYECRETPWEEDLTLKAALYPDRKETVTSAVTEESVNAIEEMGLRVYHKDDYRTKFYVDNIRFLDAEGNVVG